MCVFRDLCTCAILFPLAHAEYPVGHADPPPFVISLPLLVGGTQTKDVPCLNKGGKGSTRTPKDTDRRSCQQDSDRTRAYSLSY
jgi:hypothetical protein